MPASPNTTAAEATPVTPTSMASNADLERFFGDCGDDTRRLIMRRLGLPKRKSRPWTEIWFAVGLEAEQPEALWDELTLGSKRRNMLWDAARTAEHAGLASSTVNGYCHSGVFRDGFPRPLINISRRIRLWLPLEVCGYVAPSVYAERAAMIRRRPEQTKTEKPIVPVSYTGTMQPLPPKNSE
ncbi:hypothetical protein ATO6_23390 [Oceanicola sp. 22II-s10i]|uniref:hypothetical protein n=1 Tax=Oceanicola sp. 22II-s10i TaxID=1317116 RepID=UPI000B525BD7|nr:hypothetical protein [Oceanicola sp. 22II-s10i]OWU81752.1 hypothetical protein ATO6_23390 [Oceanicola sp. 22II-s10i]